MSDTEDSVYAALEDALEDDDFQEDETLEPSEADDEVDIEDEDGETPDSEDIDTDESNEDADLEDQPDSNIDKDKETSPKNAELVKEVPYGRFQEVRRSGRKTERELRAERKHRQELEAKIARQAQLLKEYGLDDEPDLSSAEARLEKVREEQGEGAAAMYEEVQAVREEVRELQPKPEPTIHDLLGQSEEGQEILDTLVDWHGDADNPIYWETAQQVEQDFVNNSQFANTDPVAFNKALVEETEKRVHALFNQAIEEPSQPEMPESLSGSGVSHTESDEESLYDLDGEDFFKTYRNSVN